MYLINSYHQVEQVSIESWRDQLYVLFAQDYREVVNKAHKVVIQRIQPQFDAKAAQPLNIQTSIVESLTGRIEDLSPHLKHVDQLIKGIDTNKSRFERLPLSQFLHLKFWSTLLASIVHSVALAVWNLTGSKQKIEEICRLRADMNQKLNPELNVGKMLGTKSQPGYNVFVSLNKDSDGKITNFLDFRIDIDIGPGKAEASFKARKLANSSGPVTLDDQNGEFSIGPGKAKASFKPGRSTDSSGLKTCPELSVALDDQNGDLDSIYMQVLVAVGWMKRENCSSLLIQTSKSIDLSQLGFKNHLDQFREASDSFWYLKNGYPELPKNVDYKLIDYSEFMKYSELIYISSLTNLFVTLDNQNCNLDSVYMQIVVAIGLMRKEGCFGLLIQTSKSMNLSELGFKNYSDKFPGTSHSFWYLRNKYFGTSEISVLMSESDQALRFCYGQTVFDAEIGPKSVEMERGALV